MTYLQDLLKNIDGRFGLLKEFVQHHECESIAEIGVHRGELSEMLLRNCSSIKTYYMIDPWRNLDDWNKPLNVKASSFKEHYEVTRSRTAFAEHKRIILRGKTTEVINKIREESLDLAYIDGDHTLRGITIDLISSWRKIKNNGFILGDDFCPSIWQHKEHFEPTLIFPFAIHFAEAMDVKIFALPYNQFLISKELPGFEFINYSDNPYENSNILNQLKALEKIKNRRQSNILRRMYKSLFEV